MKLINEHEAMSMTDAELVDAWSRGNDSGDGWAPGDGDEKDIDAAVLRTIYEGSGGNNSRMYLAEIDGQYCVVADCNGAWAVTL